MSFLTSLWLLLQKEQRSTSPFPVFLDIQPPGLGWKDSRLAEPNRQPGRPPRARIPDPLYTSLRINACRSAVFHGVDLGPWRRPGQARLRTEDQGLRTP